MKHERTAKSGDICGAGFISYYYEVERLLLRSRETSQSCGSGDFAELWLSFAELGLGLWLRGRETSQSWDFAELGEKIW